MQNIAKKSRKTRRVGAREYWTNTLEERAPVAVPTSGIMLPHPSVRTGSRFLLN
jgi:hypothetical protein